MAQQTAVDYFAQWVSQFYRDNKLIAITLKPGYEAIVRLENIKFKINLGTEESEQQ